jgi:hypothetical protein
VAGKKKWQERSGSGREKRSGRKEAAAAGKKLLTFSKKEYANLITG